MTGVGVVQGAAVPATMPGAAVPSAPDDPRVPRQFDALAAAGLAALEAAAGAARWDARTRRGVLAAVERHLRVVSALQAKVVSAEQGAGTWRSSGDRDLAAFLGRLGRQGRGAGFRQVGQAATLAAMPVVADALVDGPVTPAHVQHLTRATGASPVLAAELATPAGQAEVVELARRLDGQEFGRTLAQLSASLDPATRQRQHAEQRAERYLHLSHAAGGTVVKGRLDSVAGHRLQKAIDALDPRPAVDDERTREQRQADALVAMAEHALSDVATTPGAVVPPQVLVTFREDTWRALRAASDGERARASRGSTADVVQALRGTSAVVDEDGSPWPASEIARLLCDCELTRAVVDARGEVLDLGRKERLFTAAHRKALAARGQTVCGCPGCAIPLRRCEVHHMRWWERDGGETNLENAFPACPYHHHWIHDNDIRIRRVSGGYELRYPDGRVVGRQGAGVGPPPGAGPDGPAGGGAGADGAGADGAGANGAGTDGVGTDRAGTDGVGTDGVGTDGVGADGAGADGAGAARPATAPREAPPPGAVTRGAAGAVAAGVVVPRPRREVPSGGRAPGATHRGVPRAGAAPPEAELPLWTA